MNTRRKILGLAFAAWLGGAALAMPALADTPKTARPPYGPYHGMMGGYGGYGMMGPGMMAPGMMMGGYGMMGGWGLDEPWGPDLGLTDAQKKKVEALAVEAREAGRGDWQAMSEAHQKMYAAMSGDKVDRAAATAAYRQMSEAMAQHMERVLDFREKLDGVLTDKQRETLREWQRTGWGCGMGPGSGPGRMRGR